MVAAFLFLGWLVLRRHHSYVAFFFFAVAALFVVGGILFPARLGPVRRGWMKIGELLGRVTTPVIMAIFYYLVVTPIALARRVRRASTGGVGWQRHTPVPASRMERQF